MLCHAWHLYRFPHSQIQKRGLLDAYYSSRPKCTPPLNFIFYLFYSIDTPPFENMRKHGIFSWQKYLASSSIDRFSGVLLIVTSMQNRSPPLSVVFGKVHLRNECIHSLAGSSPISVYSRVPNGLENHGKPGKRKMHFPDLEKSWNF